MSQPGLRNGPTLGVTRAMSEPVSWGLVLAYALWIVIAFGVAFLLQIERVLGVEFL